MQLISSVQSLRNLIFAAYSGIIYQSIQNLYAAKLRSLLALLGIMVGAAAVVAMITSGELATNEALKQFKNLGTDLLAVTIVDDQDGNNQHRGREVTLKQAADVGQSDPAIMLAAPYTQLYSTVSYNGHPLSVTTLGVTDAFQVITHASLQQGRFVANLDRYAAYCVVGSAVFSAMKQADYHQPLGQQIKIGDQLLTVVGELSPWQDNNFVYASLDNAVLIPLLTSQAINPYAQISNIILKLYPHADIDRVNMQINAYFAKQVPGKKLYLRSAKTLLAQMQNENTILTVFLGLIGSLSLLVGGIGIMNIMLVSVVERKREIGVRLAVGARRKDIQMLFLTEAILLSLMGGGIGVIIGLLISYVIALVWHWEYIFFAYPPLLGFSISVLIGIFFGYYPAHQAAQLNPIDALRAE